MKVCIILNGEIKNYDYINSILDVLDSIKNEEVLSKEQRNISKLGSKLLFINITLLYTTWNI